MRNNRFDNADISFDDVGFTRRPLLEPTDAPQVPERCGRMPGPTRFRANSDGEPQSADATAVEL
jgi:hypothetical protein